MTKIFTEERLIELKEPAKLGLYHQQSYVVHRDLIAYIIELFEKCKKLEEKINLLEGDER